MIRFFRQIHSLLGSFINVSVVVDSERFDEGEIQRSEENRS